jgi:hypothetical protein
MATLLKVDYDFKMRVSKNGTYELRTARGQVTDPELLGEKPNLKNYQIVGHEVPEDDRYMMYIYLRDSRRLPLVSETITSDRFFPTELVQTERGTSSIIGAFPNRDLPVQSYNDWLTEEIWKNAPGEFATEFLSMEDYERSSEEEFRKLVKNTVKNASWKDLEAFRKEFL